MHVGAGDLSESFLRYKTNDLDGSSRSTIRAAARFAVDGAFYGSVAPDALLWNTSYYAILNTAIGGPWPRPPDAATTFPNYHRVDAIRVAYPTAV